MNENLIFAASLNTLEKEDKKDNEQVDILLRFSLQDFIIDQRSTTHSFQYTSIDQVMIMDLDAYNYISSVLFESIGTVEPILSSLSPNEKKKVFKQEFLSSMVDSCRCSIV
jgi:hypothetical protein